MLKKHKQRNITNLQWSLARLTRDLCIRIYIVFIYELS